MATLNGFRINSPTITHQTIDGEVVIVNLDSGCYFSLQKVGAEIWGLLEGGADVAKIVAELRRQYQAAPGITYRAVKNLIDELVGENIIVQITSSAKSTPAIEPVTNLPTVPFEPPTLQKFTDMQDLLMLDPIHEVDETGWPNMKDAA